MILLIADDIRARVAKLPIQYRYRTRHVLSSRKCLCPWLSYWIGLIFWSPRCSQVSAVSKCTAESRHVQQRRSQCRHRDRDKDLDMDMETFEFIQYLLTCPKHDIPAYIPYMYIHQILQHAADRNMHLNYLLRKSFFLFPVLQAKN